MSSETQFKKWFESEAKANGIEHFTAGEFLSYFKKYRDGVQNSMPPGDLWPLLIPTLVIAERLRRHFGKPCTLLSSYRSPDYNRAVGGESGSLHLQFNALDVTVSGVPARKVYDQLVKWRDCGCFTGGLGLYTSSNFTHLDTRGYNASWGS